MNWIKETILPKFKALVNRKTTEETLWIKCNSCSQMIFHKEYKENITYVKHVDFMDIYLQKKE